MSTTTIGPHEATVALDAAATTDLPHPLPEDDLLPGDRLARRAGDPSGETEPAAPRTTLAVFCYEDPDSPVGQDVARTVAAMARHGTSIHLFSRRAFALDTAGVRTHAVGDRAGDDLLDDVHEFTRSACNAFLGQFPPGTRDVSLLGHEWSTIPTLSLLHALRNCEAIVALHSLESQRSDMSGPTSWQIAEIELTGLREARTIVVHGAATAKIARKRLPECAGRIVEAHRFFPSGAAPD